MPTDERIVDELEQLSEMKAYMTIDGGETCMVMADSMEGLGEAVKMNDHQALAYMCKAIGELHGAVTALIGRIEDAEGL